MARARAWHAEHDPELLSDAFAVAASPACSYLN